jgi:hypothetical protein
MKDAVKKVRGESEHRRTSSSFSPHHRAPPIPLQVIAAITVGKDMNALFPDVVNCMRTGASNAERGKARPRTHALFEFRRRPNAACCPVRPPAGCAGLVWMW